MFLAVLPAANGVVGGQERSKAFESQEHGYGRFMLVSGTQRVPALVAQEFEVRRLHAASPFDSQDRDSSLNLCVPIFTYNLVRFFFRLPAPYQAEQKFFFDSRADCLPFFQAT